MRTMIATAMAKPIATLSSGRPCTEESLSRSNIAGACIAFPSIAAASALTRAADRRRSPRCRLQAYAASAMATRTDATVTTVDNMDNSQLPTSDSRPYFQLPTSPKPLRLGAGVGNRKVIACSSQRELDSDFDDDVDRFAAPPRG